MEQFEKALFIYNGNAGQKDLEKTLSATVPLLAGQLNHLILRGTTEPNHAQKLCEQYGEEVDLVIILGGDGTVHECINGLAPLAKRPAIAILPGGTCNDFSRTLGTPQNLRKATEALLSGELAPVDVMKVNDSYFLNFWGVGLVAETSVNIDEAEKAQWGKVSYYLSAIRTIRQMDPFSYEIECDGEKIAGECVMILVANGHFIGANMLPFQELAIDDGLANLFIVKNTSLTLLKELLLSNVMADKEKLKEDVLHYTGRKISIKTESEMNVDTDGEVYLKTPAEIEVLEKHFRMFRMSVSPEKLDDPVIPLNSAAHNPF